MSLSLFLLLYLSLSLPRSSARLIMSGLSLLSPFDLAAEQSGLFLLVTTTAHGASDRNTHESRDSPRSGCVTS